MVTDEAIANLRSALRHQCGFKDIAALLVEHTPLISAEFRRTKRSQRVHTRFGGLGRSPKPWYIPLNEEDFAPGWTAEFTWTVAPETSYDARALLSQLQMYGDDASVLTAKGQVRYYEQTVALFADDFPGMWLADKLRGHLA
jgi:hypothetical protein